MSYIGKEPTVGNFQKCDAISVVNGQASYTLQVGGTNVVPESVNHMLVSLNGILQAPTDSFTVSGSTLTFASNLSTGDVIDFVMILGNVLDLGVPSDNTVTAAKLNNDIISGQTELASEPADTDEFLVSDAGTIKRIDYSLIKGGGITVADQWRLTTDFSGSADPIASNLEQIDTSGQGTIGSAMTQSSGIFTFPSTGIWLVKFNLSVNTGEGTSGIGVDGLCTSIIQLTTDNSSYTDIARISAGLHDTSGANVCENASELSSLIDVTDTSNVKVKFKADSIESTTKVKGNSTQNETFFTFIRLGDT